MATQKAMDDWLKLSQDYWKGFQDLTGQAMRSVQAESTAAPWHEGLEQWTRMFRGMPGHSDASNILDQVLDHGRGYLNFLQQIASNPAAFGAQDLKSAAQRMVDEIRQANPLAQGLPFAGTPFGESFAQWLKMWQDGVAPLQADSQAFGRLPAYGMAREYVEQAQALQAAQERLRAANQAYGLLMARVLESGLERFQDKLADRAEPGGRRVDNLRALYDLFIDGLEEAYAETALGNEFRQVYGELVDAQSDLRLQVQKVVEQISASLGMPTRSEVNTLAERLQAVRRAVRKGGDQAAIVALKAEVDALRREVATLKSASHAIHDDDDVAPSSPPSGRKPKISTQPVSTRAKPGTAAKPGAATRAGASKAPASKAKAAASKAPAGKTKTTATATRSTPTSTSKRRAAPKATGAQRKKA
ncbi:MAG: poly(R)-hydroxyalkanoic acid synthase subunit PhaE [Lysobacterales bacterium]